MKPTVDLTTDRMFPDKVSKLPFWIPDEKSKYNQINTWFNEAIGKLPWEIGTLNWISSDEDFLRGDDPLIGTPEDYKHREEINKASSFDYCDRCGCRIVTPWRWDRSLCEECNIRLYNDLHYKKVPWEFDNNNSDWAVLNEEVIWIE
jgi:hypothetical protein